jgi:hypothetical protein
MESFLSIYEGFVMKEFIWDVFICHASEDKVSVVDPLFALLTQMGIRVWLDRLEIGLGDSIREMIDRGLSASRFGVVILSPNFFRKGWTKAELGALMNRHFLESKTLLPIRHEISAEELRKMFPLLSDLHAANTQDGLPTIAREIYRVVINTSLSRYSHGAPIFVGKLTKRVLMMLPENCYIHCGIHTDDGFSKLTRSIPANTNREGLWQLVKQRELNGRNVWVFLDEAAFQKHSMAVYIYPKARNNFIN